LSKIFLTAEKFFMCFRNQNIFEDIQIEYIRQMNYPRSGIWLIVDGGGGALVLKSSGR